MEEITLTQILSLIDGVASVGILVTMGWFLWRRHVTITDGYVEALKEHNQWLREHFLSLPAQTSNAESERLGDLTNGKHGNYPAWLDAIEESEPIQVTEG